MVKTPPANAGKTGLIPDQGRSHVPRSNQARLESLGAEGTEAQVLQTTEARGRSSPRSAAEEAT